MRQRSKYLSLLLRHSPDQAGLTLDADGWADVETLLANTDFTRDELHELVRTSAKQRFALSDDGRRIRANHGHSVPTAPEHPVAEPPDVLYHGTAAHSVEAILTLGLRPMKRQAVHLVEHPGLAVEVGRRHGDVRLLRVDARRMHDDGVAEFHQAPNGVWLVDGVPPDYITLAD